LSWLSAHVHLMWRPHLCTYSAVGDYPQPREPLMYRYAFWKDRHLSTIQFTGKRIRPHLQSCGEFIIVLALPRHCGSKTLVSETRLIRCLLPSKSELPPTTPQRRTTSVQYPYKSHIIYAARFTGHSKGFRGQKEGLRIHLGLLRGVLGLATVEALRHLSPRTGLFHQREEAFDLQVNSVFGQ